MIVNLIVIPKKTVPPENPQPEKKKEVKRLAAEHERVAPPVPVVEKTDSLESVLSENKVGSIQIEPWRTLPDLSSRGDLPETEKAPSDTIRMPVFFWQPKPSIEPEKKEPVPPEQAKDERRVFKTDIFGIPLNGIVALPLHLGRHALKSIVWSIGDRKKRKSGGKTADGNFTGLTEKELRFLILVWRDGLLNPQKLSRHDRLFITNAAAAGEWMTNDEFLLRMEKRGLVTSLKVEGTRVFRTIFRREEIMQSLIEALKSAQDSPERQAVFENNIGLIVRCFDDFSGKVVIPE